MHNKEKWFGSSGIRGSFDIISPEFSLKLGLAFSKMFDNPKAVYISSDIRSTSQILVSAFVAGYTTRSGPVNSIGLCPTPVLSYLSAIQDVLGVMITASHNPPSNNGFKFFLKGAECSSDFENKVEMEMQKFQNESVYLTANWLDSQEIKYQSNKFPIERYIDYLLSKVAVHSYKGNVILDCANNVPNLVSPYAIRRICTSDDQVILLNETLDFNFPGRPSEPTSQNLEVLKRHVKEMDSENVIGIAHDGDGDRFAIIDEHGDFIDSTAVINFFIDHLNYTNPNKRKIILTSDCSKQAFDIAREKGAKVITSEIGRNRDFVHDDNVLFLAEPNKLLFPELGKWIDGFYPVLKLIEYCRNEPISKVMKKYKMRKIMRKAFKFPIEEKARIEGQIQSLTEHWSKKISKVVFFDGLKLYFKDNSNLLIRFSGTEPKIKVYIESDSENSNEILLQKIQKELHLTSKGIDC